MIKEPLIEARKVKKFFKVDALHSLRALDDVSFVVNKNDKFAVVGESGCGKSTLGKVILQLHSLSSGSLIYYGKSVEDLMPKYIVKEINKLPDYQKKAQEYYQESLKIDKKVEALLDQLSSFDAEGSKIERSKHEKLHREIYELNYKSLEARKNSSRQLREGAKIVGSLILAKEINKVKDLYLEAATHTQAAHKIKKEISKLVESLKTKENSKQNQRLEELRFALQQERDQKNAILEQAEKLKESEMVEVHERAKYAHYQDRLDRHQIFGIDLSKLTKEEMRQQRIDMQMIFQDPSASLDPRLTIGQTIEEAFIIHTNFNKQTRRQLVLELLEQVGLKPELIDSYPNTLSGGQKQRVGIAKALALKPSFIVLDESVSALDVSVQAQILTLLNKLHEENELTYFFITHDLGVVKHFCNRLMVMYLGSNFEYGDSEKIFKKPLHPYTQSLLASVPKLRTRDEGGDEEEIIQGEVPSPLDAPRGCPFHTRCPKAFGLCKEKRVKLTEVEPEHFVACHLYNKEGEDDFSKK